VVREAVKRRRSSLYYASDDIINSILDF